MVIRKASSKSVCYCGHCPTFWGRWPIGLIWRFVARFSMDEIREGAFLREAIELAAVEVIVPLLTDAQLVQSRRNLRLQDILVADGDFRGFYALDDEMRELILSFTGLKKLAYDADTAWLHVNRAQQLILPMPGQVAEMLEEHKAILAALETRDPDAARQAIRAHLGRLITFLEPLKLEHPEFLPRADTKDCHDRSLLQPPPLCGAA
jgi:GntR family transcriptional regulator, rspAB operon transcriptional repressor